MGYKAVFYGSPQDPYQSTRGGKEVQIFGKLKGNLDKRKKRKEGQQNYLMPTI